MKGKILVTPRAFAKSGMAQIDMMRKEGWEVKINDTGKSYTHEEFIANAKDVDGIIVGVDTMDRGMLERCENLKAIAKYGVGVDNIDMDATKDLGIRVSRTIGSNSLSVAEHAFAQIFTLAKNTASANADVKAGNWNKPYGFELNGKTMGIIGLGNIGKCVAKIAQGIGMNVMAYDAFPIDDGYAKEHHVTISSLGTLIRESDVITIHLPLSDDTRNLIDKRMLAMMKPTAILINAARGGIVNESDLYDALVNKEIAGAGFDVFTNEPPNANEPLLTLDNFILTPHTASKTREADDNTIRMSVENIMKDLEEIVNEQ